MPVARTRSAALVGVAGHTVEVEADVGRGLVGTHFIGLLDTAISEARDRVRSALLNSRFDWPDARVTVSLSPASLPKKGSSFDLAIAMAVLGAAGMVPPERIAEPFFLGELGLDGRVRPVRGVLPAALAAVAAGARTMVVPAANAAEAALVPELAVLPVASLGELVAILREGEARARAPYFDPMELAVPAEEKTLDLADVAGQAQGRCALEICAAGGHNLWFLGPPGTGKTMLAERLTTIIPPLDREQALEVTAIHSIAGALPTGRPLLARPPFVAPHHTASAAAVIGGGTGQIRPGAVSLAHRGILFLDEAPEFPARVLDSLRQPVESGQVTVSRASGSVTFPARFTLVLAANPCPCGLSGEAGRFCTCTPAVRRRYLSRLSGPLLDRVDVKVRLSPPTRAELLADRALTESSATVAERVVEARERAARRLSGTPWRLNAEVPSSLLHGGWRLDHNVLAPLHRAVDLGTLSARGVDRVLRVAWTIADISRRPRPAADEISLALTMWMGEEL
ncbi:YifB family Mg chelatase-like AAA ATPase [Herbidospora sp. NBRC 101105]|uniref:YifB family Mg chelatase-like AAA ATPase n=1 Tax=Herbidospora sp. NBRC 101105 TaxID=3032195 RepID=UPI002556434C|nr:YifB family Mg chelatase-like AAA ATPase [Herbidospora sp. NBRC 101105]